MNETSTNLNHCLLFQPICLILSANTQHLVRVFSVIISYETNGHRNSRRLKLISIYKTGEEEKIPQKALCKWDVPLYTNR